MTIDEPARMAFPEGLLTPERGWLSGFVRSGRGLRPSPRGEYTAIIPLSPFVLPAGHPCADERVETLLQFDSLALPVERVADLAHASFGPDQATGWLAVGEMEVASSYVPLELRRIRFGAVSEGAIEAELEVLLDFEDEPGGADSGFLAREPSSRSCWNSIPSQPFFPPSRFLRAPSCRRPGRSCSLRHRRIALRSGSPSGCVAPSQRNP